MIKGILIIVGIIVLILVIIFGIIIGTKPNPEKSVNIRIKNDTGQDIENFWLGAGGTSGYNEPFGAIKKDETTSYRALDPVFAAYGKMNFVVPGGKRYLDNTDVEKHLSVKELSAGSYYTFTYKINGENVILAITKDK